MSPWPRRALVLLACLATGYLSYRAHPVYEDWHTKHQKSISAHAAYLTLLQSLPPPNTPITQTQTYAESGSTSFKIDEAPDDPPVVTHGGLPVAHSVTGTISGTVALANPLFYAGIHRTRSGETNHFCIVLNYDGLTVQTYEFGSLLHPAPSYGTYARFYLTAPTWFTPTLDPANSNRLTFSTRDSSNLTHHYELLLDDPKKLILRTLDAIPVEIPNALSTH